MPPSEHLSETPHSTVALAWNGLVLQVPAGWTPVVLDKGYLLVEDGLGPVMEVKWQRQGGRVRLDKVLRKLAKGVRGADMFGDPAEGGGQGGGMPQAWAESVAGLEGHGVQALPIFWKARDRGIADPSSTRIQASTRIQGGRGAVVRDGQSGAICLIQFYEHPGRTIAPVAASVLHGLRLVGNGQWVAWNIFGVRFQTPPWLQLREHDFRPGKYRIAFKAKAWLGPAQLLLERVGPARAVLKGKALKDWAADWYARDLRGLAPVQAENRPRTGQTALHWAGKTGTLVRRHSRAVVRLSADGQMILAAFLLRARLEQMDLFADIEGSYETVSA